MVNDANPVEPDEYTTSSSSSADTNGPTAGESSTSDGPALEGRWANFADSTQYASVDDYEAVDLATSKSALDTLNQIKATQADTMQKLQDQNGSYLLLFFLFSFCCVWGGLFLTKCVSCSSQRRWTESTCTSRRPRTTWIVQTVSSMVFPVGQDKSRTQSLLISTRTVSARTGNNLIALFVFLFSFSPSSLSFVPDVKTPFPLFQINFEEAEEVIDVAILFKHSNDSRLFQLLSPFLLLFDGD